jgi:hypothetical protein
MISKDNSIAGGSSGRGRQTNDLFIQKTLSGGRRSNEGDSSIKKSSSRKIQTIKYQMDIVKKKAEIEARKYELLQLQLSLTMANNESSQSSSKYVTLEKVCESIPEKVERWRRSKAVGNQSTINSGSPEANVYGAQISHCAERRNRN